MHACTCVWGEAVQIQVPQSVRQHLVRQASVTAPQGKAAYCVHEPWWLSLLGGLHMRTLRQPRTQSHALLHTLVSCVRTCMYMNVQHCTELHGFTHICSRNTGSNNACIACIYAARSPVKTHTHTLRFLIFGWTVPLRPLTLTLKALNTLLRPRLRVAPGQKHYSEVKVIWVQNVCWRESLLNPHTIHQQKTNPTFSIGLNGFFQFLLETTQLATTIVLASFQHVITLNFSIRSVQIIRSALLSFLSAVHSGGVSLNITMSWQSTMENLWFWSWGWSTGNNPACAFAGCSRERKKESTVFSVDYWGIVGIS